MISRFFANCPDALVGRVGIPKASTSLRVALLCTGWVWAGCKSDINIISKAPSQEEEEVVPEEFGGDWGQWLSMGVLPDGRPVAAFYDATDGALGFAIATLAADGTVAWSYEQADGYADAGGLDTGDRGKYVDMVVAANGDIWLAYQDLGNENLRYARRYYLSGEWENGVADDNSNPSSQSGMFASIALDASGNPVVAHYDGGLGELRVAHWNGSGFDGEVVDEGTAPDVAEGEPGRSQCRPVSSLQIVDGIEYIAYHDQANGDLLLATGSTGAYTLSTIASEGGMGAWPDLVMTAARCTSPSTMSETRIVFGREQGPGRSKWSTTANMRRRLTFSCQGGCCIAYWANATTTSSLRPRWATTGASRHTGAETASGSSTSHRNGRSGLRWLLRLHQPHRLVLGSELT